jgi:hypothetical protein
MKKQKTKTTRKPGMKARVLIGSLASIIVIGVAIVAVVSSQTATAQQQSVEQQSQPANEDISIQFASQNISIDAATGRLRKPTVEEARAIVKTLTGLTNRSSKGLHVDHLPNGVSRLDLRDRFQNVIVAKPNTDGTTDIRCVTTMEQATEFLGLDPSKIPGKN